jgi:prepilin-type N-terminal cleavage/methylation domain-containing protein
VSSRSPAPGRRSGWSRGNGLGSRAPGRRAQRGLTLVEILVAIALLLFGLMGFTHSILRAVSTNESTRESALAGEAARQMLETLQGAEFPNIFALYNADPNDDPGAPGSAPGQGFAVEGLEPADGDADGLVGEIFFPAADAAPGVLREDLAVAALGMPRDLNCDGVVDVDNHADDYRILPVLVRLTWQGTSGVTRVEFRTLLGDYL